MRKLTWLWVLSPLALIPQWPSGSPCLYFTPRKSVFQHSEPSFIPKSLISIPHYYHMLQAKLLTVYPFVQEHIAAPVVAQSPDVSK